MSLQHCKYVYVGAYLILKAILCSIPCFSLTTAESPERPRHAVIGPVYSDHMAVKRSIVAKLWDWLSFPPEYAIYS